MERRLIAQSPNSPANPAAASGRADCARVAYRAFLAARHCAALLVAPIAVVIEALYAAFDQAKEPTDLTIAQVLTEFVPLSKLMAEQITGLRNWAKGRARLATSIGVEKGLRKMVV